MPGDDPLVQLPSAPQLSEKRRCALSIIPRYITADWVKTSMSGASVLVWPHAETDSLAETVHALISHSGGRVNAEYSPRNRSSFCNQNVQ